MVRCPAIPMYSLIKLFALPEAVMEQDKRGTVHQNISVLDRGPQSTRTMEAFSMNQVTLMYRQRKKGN
jgi:hypothetical protein